MRDQVVVVIPARIGSLRLPGKPLLLIGSKPVIQHVWERAQKITLANHIVVSTDSQEIADACKSFGADVCITGDCLTGSDRVAWTMDERFPLFHNDTIIVNLQGDLPFVDVEIVDEMILDMMNEPFVDMITPATKKSSDDQSWKESDTVKAIANEDGLAQYFSRSPIPNGIEKLGNWLHHFGVYVFRKRSLMKMNSLPPGSWERAEGLEQLRMLEHGMMIKLFATDYRPGIEINTREDLERARMWLETNGNK